MYKYFCASLCTVKYLRNQKAIQLLGETIRKIRLAKGISLEKLALETGLEYSQVSRIELGKINTSVSHLFLLASVLQVKAADLIDFEID